VQQHPAAVHQSLYQEGTTNVPHDPFPSLDLAPGYQSSPEPSGPRYRPRAVPIRGVAGGVAGVRVVVGRHPMSVVAGRRLIALGLLAFWALVVWAVWFR